MYYFVFFKQKTAYEMRISEWSSDVCSSDLVQAPYFIDVTAVAGTVVTLRIERILSRFADVAEHASRPFQAYLAALPAWPHHAGLRINDSQRRSEEHTSELQSLMRISYAVFSLNNTTIFTIIHNS